MSANKLRDKAYQCAVRHGWHAEEKPDSHWLMMIITEVAEAVQANRIPIHSDVEHYQRIIEAAESNNHVIEGEFPRWRQISFEKYIKDSVEDELSDIIIRCYDLAGLRDFDLDEHYKVAKFEYNEGELENMLNKDFTTFMHSMTWYLTFPTNRDQVKASIATVIWWIMEYTGHHHINLDWHIREKMRYNESRPYMHNKKY